MTDFEKLVSDMRKAQSDYFRTKDANILLEAKRLEKEVDKALYEIEPQDMGGTLF